jgi:hypothetical protein
MTVDAMSPNVDESISTTRLWILAAVRRQL